MPLGVSIAIRIYRGNGNVTTGLLVAVLGFPPQSHQEGDRPGPTHGGANYDWTIKVFVLDEVLQECCLIFRSACFAIPPA